MTEIEMLKEILLTIQCVAITSCLIFLIVFYDWIRKI